MSLASPERLPRRSFLIGAAAVPLAACAQPTPATPTAPAAGQVLAGVADVPVGSGILVEGTLLTAPSPGVIKGFLARCTHAGCALTRISGGEAVCPCHGSRFGLDGAALRGPANEPLRPRAIVVRGDQILAG